MMSEMHTTPDWFSVLSEIDDRSVALALRQPATACVEAGTMGHLSEFRGCLVLIVTTARRVEHRWSRSADAVMDRLLVDRSGARTCIRPCTKVWPTVRRMAIWS